MNQNFRTRCKHGISVTLKSDSDESFPIVYGTGDGAQHWTELKLPRNQLPKTVDSLSKADSLTEENGTFTLTLGQGSGGNIKVSFQSTKLSDVLRKGNW